MSTWVQTCYLILPVLTDDVTALPSAQRAAWL